MAAPAPIIMQQDQLAQILQAIPHGGGGGGTRKLHTLSSTSGSDWITWRSHFDTVMAINAWGDLRQRRELKAAMEGDAAKLVYDIAVDGINMNIANILDLYQGRFLPAAAGRAAMVEFHAAQQRPDETPTQFHGRCREMFLRAYPGQAVENSPQLIQTFALGLIDTDVSRFVLDHGPQTFNAASNLAQTKTATESALALRHKGMGRSMHAINHMSGEIPNPDGAYAMRNRGFGSKTCYFCGKSGHLQQECDGYKKAQEYWKRTNGGNSQNNRGRGQTKGRGGNSGPRGGRKRVSQIQNPGADNNGENEYEDNEERSGNE